MSGLRGLDDRVVPRLAATLRALIDGLGNRRAGLVRAVVAPRRGRLRSLDDRFAASGPLALLRDVPQLGLLLVAAVFLAGAGVAVARNSPAQVAERALVQAEQALPLSLGPPVGADVDAFFRSSLARAVELTRDSPNDRVLALVSLTEELTPEQTGQLVAGSTLMVKRAYVRAPVGGNAEVLPDDTATDVTADLTALFAATATRR
ncbi:MAG: hypothetical protein H7323_17330, partial [Frankiales bacterium]|nr:hypothetical protein [Frankiales bacterium]